ncbi:hypothetical protein BDV96DRAFT_596511 [Lophiotrema nucula]|uniref:Uncharacterized protein n=1 Tax=Lophiotrema nucula TaxID=690887 RepID=A0A6A5ZGL8_9PLEO|nr:hypothetical protein BDV96DRAFT_596511 [Lophiotrema nucula]
MTGDSVVVCIDPNFPIRQILADYILNALSAARDELLPQAIICGTVYNQATEFPNGVDPSSPRVQAAFGSYVELPLTADAREEAAEVHPLTKGGEAIENLYPEKALTLYVRPDRFKTEHYIKVLEHAYKVLGYPDNQNFASLQL